MNPLSFSGRLGALGLLAATAAVGALSSGCSTEAYCFDCAEGAAGKPTVPTDGGSGDSGINGDSGKNDSGINDDGGKPDAGGCEADLMTSATNCGACGNVCSAPGGFPKCVAGKCAIDKCADGFVDLDKKTENGCECKKTTEICDGLDNDCDGVKDNGFDTQNDVKHCGGCNQKCADVPNADVTCKAGKCVVACKPGFSDKSGCAYKCPVQPPAAEACDGIDNDCDGVVDNGNPGGGAACEQNCPGGKCVGECKPGKTLCTGTSKGLICVGGSGPTGEICDGKDNDCNGKIDDGFDLQNDPLNCGKCGVQCAATDKCQGGKCQFTCAQGYVDLDKIPANGCEYKCPVFPAVPETCNGVDDDCDGVIDNAPKDVGTACDADCPATAACVAGGDCSPYQISPNNGKCYGVCTTGATACIGGKVACQHKDFKITETCNGLDDNCDGVVDEGYDLKSDPLNCGQCGKQCLADNAQVVACQNGACGQIAACKDGYADLDKNTANGCEYKCPVFPTTAEVCNGKDDDCDGVADDDPTDVGGSCQDACPALDPCVAAGNCTATLSTCSGKCCGVCATDGKLSCTNGAKECKHPSSGAETCNGQDDDCDGQIDEGFDLKTDAKNCGGCGNVCNLPNTQAPSCVAGKCAVPANGCAPGFADVDKDPTNGCEYSCPVNPPTAETCNGKDDNCDGQIDNNPTDVGVGCDTNCPPLNPCVAAGNCSAPLSACSGACCGVCSQGTTVCQSGQKVCQGGGGVALEVCDGKDNNCDGQIDEGFSTQSDPLNCGMCGKVCTLANAVNGCSSGNCTIVQCKPGFANNDGNVANGCEYSCPVNPPTTESCNGKDDDCNGQVDDNLPSPPNSCIQTGPCSGAKPVCQGALGYRCNYAAINSNIEVNPADGSLKVTETLCDNFDGNCNGQVDESFANKGQPCSAGNGRCQTQATFQCLADKSGTTCPAVADPSKAIDELCNGVDDNCDGNVDERVPTGSVTCFNGGAHACTGYIDPMVKVGSVWVYQYEASHPGATAGAVGSDTSRACSVSQVLPWTSINHAQAAAACAAVKNSAGQPMRLCTAAEWQASCNVSGTTSANWSYATSPTTFVNGTCNGVEAAIAAPWPGGSGGSCYANQPGGKLYDMSGNVSEWVSDSVVVNGTTYFAVRGGNYGSYSLGTNCNFDFVLEQSSYAYQDLGFRCCSTAAPLGGAVSLRCSRACRVDVNRRRGGRAGRPSGSPRCCRRRSGRCDRTPPPSRRRRAAA